MKKTVVIAGFMCAILFLSSCVSGTGSSPEMEKDQSSPKNARVLFQAETLGGVFVDESVFSGHTLTLVNVWGTFCGPCIQEMPDFGKLAQDYADRGVQVIGIVSDAGDPLGKPYPAVQETAKNIVLQTGADYIHLLPSETLYRNFLSDINAIPVTYLVDSEGRPVGSRYIGSRDYRSWAAIVDAYLEEVAP